MFTALAPLFLSHSGPRCLLSPAPAPLRSAGWAALLAQVPGASSCLCPAEDPAEGPAHHEALPLAIFELAMPVVGALACRIHQITHHREFNIYSIMGASNHSSQEVRRNQHARENELLPKRSAWSLNHVTCAGKSTGGFGVKMMKYEFVQVTHSFVWRRRD